MAARDVCVHCLLPFSPGSNCQRRTGCCETWAASIERARREALREQIQQVRSLFASGAPHASLSAALSTGYAGFLAELSVPFAVRTDGRVVVFATFIARDGWVEERRANLQARAERSRRWWRRARRATLAVLIGGACVAGSTVPQVRQRIAAAYRAAIGTPAALPRAKP